MLTGNTQMAVAELHVLAESSLVASGVQAEHARCTAEVLVLADCFGIHTHGVARVAEYRQRILQGGIELARSPAIDWPADTLGLMDARNVLGQVAAHKALHEAMAAARRSGIAAVWIKGSNHFGPAMPYCYMAAEKGFASIVASNASPTIAPRGGREARVGNNPLGIGVPAPGGMHVILDMAMSVAARAKIRAAARAGTEIPPTWATDKTGVPTVDPAAALSGFLQPFGDHKGYGLAVMVDLFAGVLSGASYLSNVSSWSDHPERPQDLGHFIMLIHVPRLGPTSWLSERMNDFAAIIHQTRAVSPESPVMLPGEREIHRLRHCEAQGVYISSSVVGELRQMAANGRRI
jgi:LDH2 family malate/lactate/ureidoglycolate dehydrogenase